MNKQKAIEEGLNFTGAYSSDKEKIKTKIAEIKKKYPKARVMLVNEPYSKLSRSGPGMGYSIYADKNYRDYKVLEEAEAGDFTKDHETRLARLKDEYEKKISEENQRFMTMKEKVEVAKNNLGFLVYHM